MAVPTLRSLGLGRVVEIGRGPGDDRPPLGAYGRMAERSKGKDSVTGHWELMGIVLDRAFPTFPDGFPADVIKEFEERIGRQSIGNVVASGTAIIDELGAEHVTVEAVGDVPVGHGDDGVVEPEARRLSVARHAVVPSRICSVFRSE